jgi:chitosanase
MQGPQTRSCQPSDDIAFRPRPAAMKPLFVYLFSLILSSTLASTYEIPPALAQLYTNLTRSAASCDSFLDGRKNLNDGHGNKGFGFCTEIPGALYLRGPRGQLGDMDVDCDGSSDCGGKSNDYQSGTAFDDELSSDRYGITSLDAEVHPYVVLGTCDVDVSKYIQPLSVVAVVCGGALHYGVFGDTNGCDDDNFTGEASLALAKLCFPDDGMSGNNGHTDHDVLCEPFHAGFGKCGQC